MCTSQAPCLLYYYTNVYQLMRNGPGYMWFISANSPHKEEALKLFNILCDPDFERELNLGRRGETWDYEQDGIPRMNEFGREQLDAYNAGSTDPENYFVKWGSFDKMPSNWPVLRDDLPHPDGYAIDFFFIDEDHLCLVIADVSGKGIPAALFMMFSKRIIEDFAKIEHSVSEILRKTNEVLCDSN